MCQAMEIASYMPSRKPNAGRRMQPRLHPPKFFASSLPSSSSQGTSRKEAIGRLHKKTGVCPWSRPNWHGESPPTTIEEYTQFLRKDGTWLGTYELNLLATELGPTEKVFTRDMRSGKWSLITRLDTSSKVIPHSDSVCKHEAQSQAQAQAEAS